MKLFILLMSVALPWVTCNGKTHKSSFSNEAANDVLQSEDYPEPYPSDLNVTWTWEVDYGQWGVVFEDFDLDSDYTGSSDYLEVIDGSGKLVRYTDDNPPLMAFRTGGPSLVIRFITDKKTEPDSRGFKLHILYGRDKSELDIKIHDATQKKHKEEKEESNLLLIVIAAALILLIIVIIIVGYLLWRRRSSEQHGDNRNAFGIRRGSGISHNRRQRPSPNGGPPDNDQRQLQPLQQHSRRIERPVQRSDSQLTWIARAELTTTIQTAGRSPQPNIYTPTGVTKETEVKAVEDSTNERIGATANNGSAVRAPSDRGSSSNGNDGRNNTRHAGAQRLQSVRSTVSNSSRLGSPTSVTGSSQNFSTSVAAAAVSTSPTSPGATRNDGAASGEYVDTVDSLNVMRGSHDDSLDEDDWQEDKPPSYDDSHLLSPPPSYQTQSSASSAVCYENVVVHNNNSSNSCPGNRCTGSQTNIYINAGGLTRSSNGSLNRITIGASSSATMTCSHEDGSMACADEEQDRRHDLSQGKMATAKQNEANIRMSRSPTGSKRMPKTPTSSASTVQIVEGYAYLVPPSTAEDPQEKGRRNVAVSSDRNPQWSMANRTSIHLDIVPSVMKTSSLDAENGYIDVPRNVPRDDTKLYVNVQNDQA